MIERKCGVCEKPLTGKQRKFCSRACSSKGRDTGRALTPKTTPYAEIKKWAGDGLTLEGISSLLGVSRPTLRRAMERDDKLREAFDSGRELEEQHLVSILRKEANAGNIVSAMFLLKSRHGYRDRGDSPVTAVQSNVTVSLPAPMSADDYARVVNAEVEEIEDEA